jgi:hypothetical protein
MNYSLNFHDYLNKISRAGGAFHSKSQQIFRSRGASRPTRPTLGTPLHSCDVFIATLDDGKLSKSIIYNFSEEWSV